MPLAGYTCPSTSPTAGQRNSVEHCLGACPHPCVSPPLLAAIYNAEHRNHHKGVYISASMIAGGGCKRQTYYERFFDFYEVPRRRYWPFRGTMAHRIIEDCAGLVEPFGWVQEVRMSIPLSYPDEPMPVLDDDGNWTGEFDHSQALVIEMGGTTDAYKLGLGEPFTRRGKTYRYIDPETTRLDDYKTMADTKAAMVIKGEKGGSFNANVEDYWVWQTNIYSVLIAATEISDEWRTKLKKHGILVPEGMSHFPRPTSIQIQGIGMMEIPITGQEYEPLRSRGATYKIEPIPVLPEEEVWEFIRAGAYQWYRYLILKELPPVVPYDELWKCRSCPFNGELIEGERCFPREFYAQGGE